MAPFRRIDVDRSSLGRRRLLVQLIATLLVLGVVPGNALKLVLFLAIWIVTFGRLSPGAWLAYLVVCALFSILDIMAVRQGIFHFTVPDVGGLPLWEYFMWGFYALHVVFAVDGPRPAGRPWLAVLLAVIFALPFSSLSDSTLLLGASAAAVAAALIFFHDRWDLSYVGYTLIVGAIVEYTGVWSGQWVYPASPPGGVPLWFATMWAGIGLFIRRLIVPLMDARSYTERHAHGE